MKRLTLQIDSCRNCIFLNCGGKKKDCHYALIMVDGLPVPVKNDSILPEWCPLCDAEEKDSVPARIRYVVENDCPTIYIDN